VYNVTYAARMPEPTDRPTDVEEINVELFTRSTRGAYPKEKNEQRERADSRLLKRLACTRRAT